MWYLRQTRARTVCSGNASLVIGDCFQRCLIQSRRLAHNASIVIQPSFRCGSSKDRVQQVWINRTKTFFSFLPHPPPRMSTAFREETACLGESASVGKLLTFNYTSESSRLFRAPPIIALHAMSHEPFFKRPFLTLWRGSSPCG